MTVAASRDSFGEFVHRPDWHSSCASPTLRAILPVRFGRKIAGLLGPSAMSTSIESVVDVEATPDEALKLAHRVVDELLRRGIILVTPQRHEYLGDGPRYARGPNVSSAARYNDCFPCGLDVEIGRRVYDAGENGLNSILCPICANLYDLEIEGWASAIGEWANQQGSGILTCTKCQHSASVVSWQFDPVWGFGELAFRFSEWFLREEFVQELSQLLGHRVTWVQSYV
jgi:hypothetical protein